MTIKPGHPREDAETYAALYVLGSLSPSDAALFEVHLATGCDECDQEDRAIEHVSSDLALSVATTPPREVRERVLNAIRTSSPSTSSGAGTHDRSTILARATPWKQSGFPGITIRPLYVDRARGRETRLVRMEAGASYLPHHHEGVEESFVLEGDIACDGETLTAGDYHRAEAGPYHGVQTTSTGCMLLIISASSPADHPVDAPQP